MLDIFNPIHNLKEICKEFVLLEDHLQAPEKRCNDCIRKHLLKAEAFAEEAIALDKTNKYKSILKPLPVEIREVQEDFINGADEHFLGQKVRMIRKRLAPICFNANLNTSGQKRTIKIKRKDPIEKQIADLLWPKRKHLHGYKYLILGLQKSANKKGTPFIFQKAGVSAKRRNSSEWIITQAVQTLQRGQVGRMISQTLHSEIEYEPEDWIGAVRSDILGEQRISLQTPSSSIGEVLADERVRKKAVQKAIDSGQKEILKRACVMEKQGETERAANMFMHIGKQTKNVYFFVKASHLFEKIGSEREAEAFQEILKIEPNHPLKFWLGNKIQIADKIKDLPAQTVANEKEEPKDNLLLLSILAFGAGVGLGIV